MQPPVCLGMNPTHEELKIPYIVELFPRGDLAIVEAETEPPRKKFISESDPQEGEVYEWQVNEVKGGLEEQWEAVETSPGHLYNINDNLEGNPTTSKCTVLFQRQVSLV